MAQGSPTSGARRDDHYRAAGARALGAPAGLEEFASWIEDLMRGLGYDIDSPRGGGKSKLADDAGVHRAAVSRLLQRQSMPDLDTMRRLATVLRVPLRDMLIRSGKLTERDLPVFANYAAEDEDEHPSLLTPEEAARRMGIPAERREMFIRVARQFLPDDLTGDER